MAEEQEQYGIAPEWERLDTAVDAENAYAEQKEEGNTEAIDPTSMTTDQAVKGGPGDYSWGAQPSNIQKPENVSQEDWDNRPQWSRGLENEIGRAHV